MSPLHAALLLIPRTVLLQGLSLISPPITLLSAPFCFPREKECSPVVKELQDSLCTRYHCSLTVSNPSAHSQYTVSVRLRKQGKFIKSSEHSEFTLHGFPGL